MSSEGESEHESPSGQKAGSSTRATRSVRALCRTSEFARASRRASKLAFSAERRDRRPQLGSDSESRSNTTESGKRANGLALTVSGGRAIQKISEEAQIL